MILTVLTTADRKWYPDSPNLGCFSKVPADGQMAQPRLRQCQPALREGKLCGSEQVKLISHSTPKIIDLSFSEGHVRSPSAGSFSTYLPTLSGYPRDDPKLLYKGTGVPPTHPSNSSSPILQLGLGTPPGRPTACELKLQACGI